MSSPRALLPATAAVLFVAGLVAPAAGQSLVAAVLPASRSVQVGVSPTVFATVINGGTATATNCTIGLITSIPGGGFSYFATDPQTNAIVSAANPVVAIAPGGRQTFVLVFTTQAAFGPTDVGLAHELVAQTERAGDLDRAGQEGHDLHRDLIVPRGRVSRIVGG